MNLNAKEKKLLLEIINTVNFPGKILEEVYLLKRKIEVYVPVQEEESIASD